MAERNVGRGEPAPQDLGRGPVMRTQDAARYVGCARATLAKLRCVGGGPVFIKAGPRRVLYRVTDLDAWLDSHGTRRSTADGASAA